MPEPDAGSRRIASDTPTGTAGPETSQREDVTRLVDGPSDRAVREPAPAVHRPAAPVPAATATTRTTVHTPPAPQPVHTPPAPQPEQRPARGAKTSAAAVFALVFGLAALFCALTAILSPAAILFGVLGLILAFIGMRMAKRPGVTGRGVAIGGLVTALLGLILGGVVIGGLTAVVNNKTQLDRIQRYVDDARAKLPSTSDVRNGVNNVTGN